MRHGTQGHVYPRERLHGAEVERMCGRTKRVHADAGVVPRGKMVFGLAGDGPTGIVGPCELFGTATQRPQGLSPFICRISGSFFRVGLCSLLNFFFAGHMAEQGTLDLKLIEDRPLIRWISVHRIIHQARVLIAFYVTRDGCDSIAVLTSHLATRVFARGSDKDRTGEISGERGSSSWAMIPLISCDRTAQISSQNGRSAFLTENSL